MVKTVCTPHFVIATPAGGVFIDECSIIKINWLAFTDAVLSIVPALPALIADYKTGTAGMAVQAVIDSFTSDINLSAVFSAKQGFVLPIGASVKVIVIYGTDATTFGEPTDPAFQFTTSLKNTATSYLPTLGNGHLTMVKVYDPTTQTAYLLLFHSIITPGAGRPEGPIVVIAFPLLPDETVDCGPCVDPTPPGPSPSGDCPSDSDSDDDCDSSSYPSHYQRFCQVSNWKLL